MSEQTVGQPRAGSPSRTCGCGDGRTCPACQNCPECGGTGGVYVGESEHDVCASCGGSGRVEDNPATVPPRPTTHMCPPGDSGTMPCCGRTPFEVPATDRMTLDSALVDCEATDD